MLKCPPELPLVSEKTEAEFSEFLQKQEAKPALVLLLDTNGDITPLRFRTVEARLLQESDFPLEVTSIERFPETFSIVDVESKDGCQVVSGNGRGVWVPCR